MTQTSGAGCLQAFSAWIHTCAVRLFTESILRYGLPPQFLGVLMKPNAKAQAKLRKSLASIFGATGTELSVHVAGCIVNWLQHCHQRQLVHRVSCTACELKFVCESCTKWAPAVLSEVKLLCVCTRNLSTFCCLQTFCHERHAGSDKYFDDKDSGGGGAAAGAEGEMYPYVSFTINIDS